VCSVQSEKRVGEGSVGRVPAVVARLVEAAGVAAELTAGFFGELDLLGGGGGGRGGALHGEERGLRGRGCQGGPGVDGLGLGPWVGRGRRRLLGEVVG
jgi:hypothetical protein